MNYYETNNSNKLTTKCDLKKLDKRLNDKFSSEITKLDIKIDKNVDALWSDMAKWKDEILN